MSEIELATVEDLKRSLESRGSVDPRTLDPVVLDEAECLGRVALLPKDMDDRTRYFANVLVQMFGVGSHVKDDQTRFVIGRLGQAMTYLVNSSSWRHGELHDFDRDEIRRKLSAI